MAEAYRASASARRADTPPLPAAVSHSAGTIAAFYYKNIRESPIPTKDYVAAFGQDVKMTAEQFDRQVYAYALGMLEAWGLKQGHKIGVWCTNELESVVAQYAAALIGIEVIVMDPVLSFAAVKQLINTEGIRALIISPRFGGEDRHKELAKQFEPELEYTAFSAGYSPLASKRFRSLKYLACTGKEFVDGVMRFNELPVYGGSESREHAHCWAHTCSPPPHPHPQTACTRTTISPRCRRTSSRTK
jgi:acyl-CoA synthetase (AMP-forming)/AMP-acid ligase II